MGLHGESVRYRCDLWRFALQRSHRLRTEILSPPPPPSPPQGGQCLALRLGGASLCQSLLCFSAKAAKLLCLRLYHCLLSTCFTPTLSPLLLYPE